MLKLQLSQRKVSQDLARFTKRDTNLALYHAIDGHPSKFDISGEAKHSLPPSYRLLWVDGREVLADGEKTFEIALLNDLTKQVAYYTQVVATKLLELHGRSATELLVWRSSDQQHSQALRDLGSNVLFNYVLERHIVVLSDSTHFYKRLMSSALARYLYVYLYHMQEARLERISDQVALDDAGPEHYIAVLSKSELCNTPPYC